MTAAGTKAMPAQPPLLVVFTGMPSSGKSSVAEALSRDLRLPLIAKDAIKERLYDALGAGDVAWSGRLGDAAYALIFSLAGTLLASGVSPIVEANFFHGAQESRFDALPEHRIFQIVCEAPLRVLLERYASRERHPGHHDDEKIHELAGRFESGTHRPLELTGDLVRLDTTRPADVAGLVSEVSALL